MGELSEAFELRVDDFLEKPFAQELLDERIKRCLATSSAGEGSAIARQKSYSLDELKFEHILINLATTLYKTDTPTAEDIASVKKFYNNGASKQIDVIFQHASKNVKSPLAQIQKAAELSWKLWYHEGFNVNLSYLAMLSGVSYLKLLGMDYNKKMLVDEVGKVLKAGKRGIKYPDTQQQIARAFQSSFILPKK